MWLYSCQCNEKIEFVIKKKKFGKKLNVDPFLMFPSKASPKIKCRIHKVTKGHQSRTTKTANIVKLKK